MPVDGDLVERLDEQVVSLSGTDPESGLEDLRPLAPVLEDRTVVGLGEATHGTREFFRLKHRLVRFLVAELDVRLLGLEAGFPETLAVDDYVVSGEGDPRSALGDVHFWTWNTEEMVALLRWLRAFNEGRPGDDRVRFHGYDGQFAGDAATALSEFLRRADPPYHEVVGEDLATLASAGPRDDPSKEWLLAADRVAAELADRFEDRAAEYRAAAGTDREWRRLRRHRRVVEQAYDLAAALTLGDGDPNAVRDAHMAENVGWLLDHEDADRMALWAHNGHVKTGPFRDGFDDAEATPETMGQHLRGTYGDDYYALGLEFGRGSFRALPDPGGEGGDSLRSFAIDSPPDDSVAAALSAVESPVCYLDVESAAADPEVRGWLGRERPLHNIGSVYYGPDAAFVPVAVAEEYDGLLFVEETTPARPA